MPSGVDSICSRSGCWLQAMLLSAVSRSAALLAPAMAPAKSTPVPSGRLIRRASPGCSPDLSQGDGLAPFTVRVTCTPRLAGTGAGLRDSIVWPPISSAPCSSSTERMPARVCTSSSCCSMAGIIGSVIVAMALETGAPQAQRSEQACSAVRRPLSQGSLTRAGKPSTLCSIH